MPILDRVLALLGLDPFAYLVVTILGVVVWTYCSTIGDVSLVGRGVWTRRAALVAATAGVVLFTYSVRSLV